MMGSLPHGVSPGISLSLGNGWCRQVHREPWRLGRWREAPPAYFSAQPLGPNSGGTAAPVQRCSRWLSKAKKGLGGGTSGGWRPEHQLKLLLITQMCLCHKKELLSPSSHLSSFSCARLLLRMLPFLGCGSNKTSILDLTFKLLTLFL